MSSQIQISTPVVKFLEAHGMIPPNCFKVELHVPPNGPMVLRYEVFITRDRMRILSQAFALMADVEDESPS